MNINATSSNKATDVDGQGNEGNLDLNYKLKRKLDKMNVIKKKVQNTTTIPQELRNKRDKQTDRSGATDIMLEDTAASAWRHCDCTLDEDIYTIAAAGHNKTPTASLQITSIDGFFNRKRGRPPKNRFVEVYKNTLQKPQAIFTSFKLEKQNQADAVANPENSFNRFPESEVAFASGSDNVNHKKVKYLGYEPKNQITTLRKCLSREKKVLNNLATLRECSCSRCKNHLGDKNSKNSPSIKTEEAEDKRDCCLPYKSSYGLLLDKSTTTPQSTAFCEQHVGDYETPIDSVPDAEKLKLVEAAERVTVIRAAGTYYPENANGDCKKLKKGTADFNNEEQRNLFCCKNKVPTNLSLEETMKMNTITCFDTSSTSSTKMPDHLTNESPIYNVLQMQQQLFALYQQMALLSPTLLHLDLMTLVNNNHMSDSTNLPTSSITPASNIILKQQADQQICSVSAIQTTTDSQLDEKTTITKTRDQQICSVSAIQTATDSQLDEKTTITTAATKKRNKIKNRLQKRTTPLDISAAAYCTPLRNILPRQAQHNKERLPADYLRYRFNEDCGYEKCGFRQHQSHFHCNRPECQYSFCDKSRFVQHTARHERLDNLMGGDFKQYRTTMTCHYPYCPYLMNGSEDYGDILNGRKSSHFHCLKCPFVCADTSKVVAHRRLHSKMELIHSAGFRKVNSNENCLISNIVVNSGKYQRKGKVSNFTLQPFERVYNQQPSFDTVPPHCPYAMRLGHYHCLVCNGSVLSKSQLLAHKHRTSLLTTNKLQTLGTASLPELQNS